MDERYNFINSRVVELAFNEDLYDSSEIIELELNVNTTIMRNESSEEEFLIRIKFNLNDKKSKFTFVCSIINNVSVIYESDTELKEIIEERVIPDLLKRGREVIKNITTNMNIEPIKLLPLDREKAR